MTAKEYLSQAYRLDQRINSNIEEVTMLREMASRPYSEIVELARTYIRSVGGFEKFAEWGLV